MHAAIEFAIFWAFGFFTLGIAVVLLNIFGGIIQSDMELLSPGKEAIVAGISSLIEAACVWSIIMFIPAMHRGLALRAMIFPIIIVILIYKLAHLGSWSAYEAALLLIFQVAVGCLIASLVTGHFLSALMVIVVFGATLAIIAAFLKGLWD